MARPPGQAKKKTRELLEAQRAFGRAVRKLRERKKLSQEELAADAKVHRNYIGLVERGVVNPTLWSIMRLAKALQTDASRLIAETEREASRH